MPELEMLKIVKRYRGAASAVDGVDLAVDSGEIVCLLGPSGCGKTTLLRIIAGLEQPDEGIVRFRGTDMAGVPVHKRGFGLMFQEFALFPHKSVAENIAFGLRMADKPTEFIVQRVDAMLDLVNLRGLGGRTVFELSGGERQRVALARSLAPAPQLLMLDEPLGSLDRSLREEILGDLRAILKAIGVTTVYVTHDQEEAFALGDRVVIMRSGRIAQVGSPLAVFRHPASRFVAGFLGLNNQVPARISSELPGLVSTQFGDFRSFRLTAGLRPGLYTLIIRPEGARVAREPAASAGSAAAWSPVSDAPDADLILTGRLTACTFRGSLQRVILEAPSADRAVSLTFDLPAYQTSLATGALEPVEIPAFGQPVRLILYPALMSLLPDDPS